MFGKSKEAGDSDSAPAPVQQVQRPVVGSSAPTPADSAEAVSSISAGVTIVGKFVSDGTVKIFGRVEGELRASTVLISAGAHVEGDIVADELTIGGNVKGTVHANRVKLNSSAVFEGDIFHRSLSIEENARFEGSSRREDAAVDASARVQPVRPLSSPAASVSADAARKFNGTPGGEVRPAPLIATGTVPPAG